MLWKRGCVFGLQVCGLGLDLDLGLGLEGCGLVNITVLHIAWSILKSGTSRLGGRNKWHSFSDSLCMLVLFTNRKWHTGFQLVPKMVTSMTLNRIGIQVIKHCAAISATAEPLVFHQKYRYEEKVRVCVLVVVNQGFPTWGTLIVIGDAFSFL